MSKHLIMGTAGHVDHGKTALINALTGIDCDTHKEEKERGITINLGFAHLELESGISLGIVDVPGHKDFIKTMVAGAYGIDFVLLVVAADSGIMPQTREHFNIMRMLGVTRGLIALTKSDIVDEEMLELASLEIMEFLEGSPMDGAPIIPVSSHTGKGLEELKKEIEKIASEIPEKSHTEQFRLYIDRIFNVKGQGIVVTGSVLGGTINAGQEIFLLPGYYDKVRIKSIQRHGEKVESVSAGDRAALNLSGLKYDQFQRGMLLTGKLLDEITLLDARVELFDHMVRLKPWSQVIFHTGTFYTKARMHLLTADSLSGKESSVVQVHLENPAILLKNDKFIIRNSSNDLTLGGGTILDTQPLHHRRRTEKLKNKMQVLADAMINQANRFQLLMFEMEKEGKPVLLSELSERVSMPVAEILKACNENQGKLIRIEVDNEAYLFSESYQNSISNKIIKEISDFHAQNKLVEKGLDIKELNSKLAISSTAELEILGTFLENLVKEEKLKTVDKSYALKSHRVKPDKKMQEQIEWINYATSNRGFQRIIVSELATKAQHEGIKKGQLIALLKFMSGRDELFFNGEDIIHSSVLNPARTKLLRHLLEKPMGINEKEFRILLDAPKKTSQVLIDIFLKEGIISKETFYLHITETGKKSI